MSEESKISQLTILTFQQDRNLITGRYSGGGIAYGFLVGKFVSRVRGEFRYVQISENGLVDSGKSTFVVEEPELGFLRFIECYEWTSRVGMGVNVFEQIDLR